MFIAVFIIIAGLFVEPNPIGVNTMMSMTGLCQPVFRLPYVQYDEEMRQKGKVCPSPSLRDHSVRDLSVATTLTQPAIFLRGPFRHHRRT